MPIGGRNLPELAGILRVRYDGAGGLRMAGKYLARLDVPITDSRDLEDLNLVRTTMRRGGNSEVVRDLVRAKAEAIRMDAARAKQAKGR